VTTTANCWSRYFGSSFLKKLELNWAADTGLRGHRQHLHLEGHCQHRDQRLVPRCGGYNKATRAPNLGELFLNTQEFFGTGGAFGDPCGARSNAPYGAGGVAPDPIPGNPATETTPQLASGQTLAGAQSAYLICQAMMTTQGLLRTTQVHR
jgi:hypothetical protein